MKLVNKLVLALMSARVKRALNKGGDKWHRMTCACRVRTKSSRNPSTAPANSSSGTQQGRICGVGTGDLTIAEQYLNNAEKLSVACIVLRDANETEVEEKKQAVKALLGQSPWRLDQTSLGERMGTFQKKKGVNSVYSSCLGSSLTILTTVSKKTNCQSSMSF